MISLEAKHSRRRALSKRRPQLLAQRKKGVELPCPVWSCVLSSWGPPLLPSPVGVSPYLDVLLLCFLLPAAPRPGVSANGRSDKTWKTPAGPDGGLNVDFVSNFSDSFLNQVFFKVSRSLTVNSL